MERIEKGVNPMKKLLTDMKKPGTLPLIIFANGAVEKGRIISFLNTYSMYKDDNTTVFAITSVVVKALEGKAIKTRMIEGYTQADSKNYKFGFCGLNGKDKHNIKKALKAYPADPEIGDDEIIDSILKDLDSADGIIIHPLFESNEDKLQSYADEKRHKKEADELEKKLMEKFGL